MSSFLSFPIRAMRLLFAMTFCYIFVASGLIASLLCVLLIVLFWPCAKTTYRRLACWLWYSLAGEMVWVCREWATVDVVCYGEPGVFDKLGVESALITCSHRGDLDWVVGIMMGAYYNFMHAIRSLPKRSMLYVPGLGQIIWALENPFLKRNYAKDRATIAKFSNVCNTYPYPVQVAIFCEGTRYTVAKHKLAIAYAREKGLPELKHHLIPRTKGFANLAEHFKPGGKITAVYDVAFAYRKWSGKHLPSFLDILMGRKVEVLWYMKRYPMEDLPSGHEELQKFCYQMFQHKDEAYGYFLAHDRFPGVMKPLPPHSRTMWLLRVNTVFWAVVTFLIPLLVMWCTLSWTSLGLVALAGIVINGIGLAAMLKFAYGGDIPTDIPVTEETLDKKKTE